MKFKRDFIISICDQNGNGEVLKIRHFGNGIRLPKDRRIELWALTWSSKDRLSHILQACVSRVSLEWDQIEFVGTRNWSGEYQDYLDRCFAIGNDFPMTFGNWGINHLWMEQRFVHLDTELGHGTLSHAQQDEWRKLAKDLAL